VDYFYYERGTVMCKKILFCNLSYMKFYNEITEYDKPCNGGKYVNDNNYAHEKNNFKVYDDDFCYGYVSGYDRGEKLDISKIDKVCSQSDDKITGVLVVFCATRPEYGRVIVGWYKDATVYRYEQDEQNKRFRFKTHKENAFLLDESERNFAMPSANDKKIGFGIGQKNVWYGYSSKYDDKALKYREDVCNYVNSEHNYINNKYDDVKKQFENIENFENNPVDISKTEIETIVKQRVGQSGYRERLLTKYKNRCALCGLNNILLLRASHIKEWSKSDNKERLDVNNGILLCTLHDSLFDKHLISFDVDGNILISNRLNEKDRGLTNIKENDRIELNVQMQRYMEYHREIFKYMEEQYS